MGYDGSGAPEEQEENGDQSGVVPVTVAAKRVFAGGEWVTENLAKCAKEDKKRKKLVWQRQAEDAEAVQRGKERVRAQEVHKQAQGEQRRATSRHKKTKCGQCSYEGRKHDLEKHEAAKHSRN